MEDEVKEEEEERWMWKVYMLEGIVFYRVGIAGRRP